MPTKPEEEVYAGLVADLANVINELPAARMSLEDARREESLARGRVTTVTNRIRSLQTRRHELITALQKMEPS